MHGLFGCMNYPGISGIALSFFVYVVLVNAFNLIDGVDGLAQWHRVDRGDHYGMWLFLAGDVAYSLLAFVLMNALSSVSWSSTGTLPASSWATADG